MLTHVFENMANFLKKLNTINKTTHPKCKTPHISWRIKNCTHNKHISKANFCPKWHTLHSYYQTFCPPNSIKSTLLFDGSFLCAETSALHKYVQKLSNFSKRLISATCMPSTYSDSWVNIKCAQYQIQ